MPVLILGILAALGLAVAAIHTFLALPLWLAILIVVILVYIVIHFI